MKYFFQSTAFIFLILIQGVSYADSPYYLDFKYILNESEAGKKANKTLKNQLDQGIKTLKEKETEIGFLLIQEI